MKVCPKCDKQWPDEANFCPADGTRLVTSAPAPPPGAMPPASARRGPPPSAVRTTRPAKPGAAPAARATSRPAKLAPGAAPGAAASQEAARPASATQGPREATSRQRKGGQGERNSGARETFSETSWFMAVEDIEKALEGLDELPETVKLDVDERKYRPKRKLKTEIRRRYSLRIDDET